MKQQVLCSLTLFILLSACGAPNGEVFSQAGLSRSYTYIVLPEPGDVYKAQTAVGGEHINIQKLWIFRDQEYAIDLVNADDTVRLHLDSEHPDVRIETHKHVGTYRVTLDDSADPSDAIIEISQLAAGYGDYELVIERKR